MAATIAPEKWRRLSVPAKVRLRWRLRARPKQLTPKPHILCTTTECDRHIEEAKKLYPSKRQAEERILYLQERGHFDWTVWLILAGRGWGKTRTGAEDTIKYMLEHPGVRVALIAATFADGRDTMVEGESGILSILPRSLLLTWNRSMGELVLVNGSRAKIFSAEEPERLRGPQHHRAWCDELAAWSKLRATWDMMMFGLRLGENPQVIITTTPRPLKFLRKKLRDAQVPAEGIVVTKGRMVENAANLARTTVKALQDTYAGTRLGRQELDAEVLEENEGTVIRLQDIEDWRCELRDLTPEPEDFMGRIVIGVDPAVTATSNSNETGVVVVGMSAGPCPVCPRSINPQGRKHAFVLEDATPGKVSPNEWGTRVVTRYRRWKADRVVAEVNNGGDLVEANMHAVDATLPVKQVRASRGKVKRAEPIGALYERGFIHHVGHFPRLEDQLISLGQDEDEEDDGMTQDEEDGSSSPDRADACVWALTELLVPDEVTRKAGTMVDARGRGDR